MSLPEGSLLFAAALGASAVAALTGTGGGVLLLPVMVAIFGVRDAVPMYTVAQLVGNLSRVFFNRKQIRLPVVGWFSVGAIPMAVLGALAFSFTPESMLIRLLGGFLLVSVLLHRAAGEGFRKQSARWFVAVGGIVAFISALVGSAGPFLAPIFTAFGLTRGAYIGTEALSTAVMHITKLSTYGCTGVLTGIALVMGAALGPVMILGSWIGKRMMDRISDKVFLRLVDAVVIVFGVLFLSRGSAGLARACSDETRAVARNRGDRSE